MGEAGVKPVDKRRLELSIGGLKRGECVTRFVLEQAHPGEFVVGRLELGVDLEDGLEVGGRLVEFIEVALDAAEHEQRTLVGGALAEDGLELLGGVLALVRAQVKVGQLLADAEQAGVQLDQLGVERDGLVVFAPDFVVVG